MTSITMSPAVARPRLRLTRRGRVVFSLLAAGPLLAAALVFGWGDGGAVAGSDTAVDTFGYVTVAPGQSLWELAEGLAPHADPRDVIADIRALNQLASAEIVPGQQLAIPTAYQP